MRISNAAKLLAAGVAIAIATSAVVFLAPTPAPPLPQIPPPVGTTAQAHLPFGPVNPRKPLPAMSLVMQDGSVGDLSKNPNGRWRLVQLVFTNCAAICPLQGAIFQRTQQLLREAGLDAELLSISIDPENDSPRALADWLAKYDAGTNWRAGAVKKDDVGALLDFFNGRKKGLDLHDARVYFIDPQGRLAYSTEDLPDPTALISLLRQALAS